MILRIINAKDNKGKHKLLKDSRELRTQPKKGKGGTLQGIAKDS